MYSRTEIAAWYGISINTLKTRLNHAGIIQKEGGKFPKRRLTVDSMTFDPPIPEMVNPLKALKKNLLSGSMKIGFYGSTQLDSALFIGL